MLRPELPCEPRLEPGELLVRLPRYDDGLGALVVGRRGLRADQGFELVVVDVVCGGGCVSFGLGMELDWSWGIGGLELGNGDWIVVLRCLGA